MDYTSSSTEKVALRFLQAPHHDLWMINMIGLNQFNTIKYQMYFCFLLETYIYCILETYFDSSSAAATAASRDGCHAYSSPQPLDRSVTSDVRVEVRGLRRRKRDNKAIVQETAEVPALWSVYYVLFPALGQFLKTGMSSQTWSDICLSDIYLCALRMGCNRKRQLQMF